MRNESGEDGVSLLELWGLLMEKAGFEHTQARHDAENGPMTMECRQIEIDNVPIDESRDSEMW